MRVVFMGTPELAATVLEGLRLHHEVVGVFTRPDAVRGRGKRLVASPVKLAALDCGLDVFTPQTLKDDATASLIASLHPDIICVAAYGCILPGSILGIPVHGCLNVHTSLLPRWRGAAPIERAILAGDEMTGVCIMRMEEGLDTGPYCIRRETAIDGLYLEELASRLAAIGADALIEAIGLIESGDAAWTDQGAGGLTYAHKLGKDELACAPDDSVRRLDAKVRAASSSRPAKIRLAGRDVAIERVAPADPALADAVKPRAGEAAIVAKRLLIGASDGGIELVRVKPDGKRSMEGRAFAAGIRGMKNGRVKWERT